MTAETLYAINVVLMVRLIALRPDKAVGLAKAVLMTLGMWLALLVLRPAGTAASPPRWAASPQPMPCCGWPNGGDRKPLPL